MFKSSKFDFPTLDSIVPEALNARIRYFTVREGVRVGLRFLAMNWLFSNLIALNVARYLLITTRVDTDSPNAFNVLL